MLVGSPGPGSPPGYTVIGFKTDNPGAWVMHCHIIWHVDGGLALQWIERPDEIPVDKYCGKSYNDECSAMTSYEAEGPWRVHGSGSSGLKARSYFNELVHSDVVRRGQTAEKQYLDSLAKRHVGDGHKARHIARR